MHKPRTLSPILIATLTLATLMSVARAHAAPTPADEDRIEDDLSAEDDGSPSIPPPKKKIGEDSAGTTHASPPPPPNADELTPPPQEPSVKETEVPPPSPTPEAAPPEPVRKAQPEPTLTGRHKHTSGSGTPIFDWSKHQGEEEVRHPFANKGLLRITKDRTYIYKVGESDQRHAAAFHAGAYHPTNLVNPDEASGTRGATFDENYQQADAPAFMFDYEWQMWQAAIGKIGLKAGSGFYVAQGNGHFVHNNVDLTPREVFTFALIPINLGVVYRLQIFHRQMFVPYGEGGGTIFGFTELRDDNKAPKFGGALGAYFAGGLALNLTYFDALSRIQLDREYSINNIYLTAEYRQILSFSRYDLSSSLINGGFLMEY